MLTESQNSAQTSDHRIGASVEAELDATLWKLVAGELELHDLTPALQAIWAVAHADGYNAGYATTNEWLRFDRDRFYFLWANKSKHSSDFYTHLTDRLWDAADRGEEL